MRALPVLVACELYSAKLPLAACVGRHLARIGARTALASVPQHPSCASCATGAERAVGAAPVERALDAYGGSAMRSRFRPGTRPRKPCSYPGCPFPHNAKGYCRTHYQRSVTGADMHAPLRGPRGAK